MAEIRRFLRFIIEEAGVLQQDRPLTPSMGRPWSGQNRARQAFYEKTMELTMNNIQEKVVGATKHIKEYTIIVNGRERKVTTDELSYKEVVDLAYDNNPPTGSNVLITVTYRNAAGNKQGTLMPCQTLEIRNGTIFNVTATNQS